MTQDPTRADFEEWYKNKYVTAPNTFRVDGNTGYYYAEPDGSWQAWQAATKHQSKYDCGNCTGFCHVAPCPNKEVEEDSTPKKDCDKCAGLVGALQLVINGSSYETPAGTDNCLFCDCSLDHEGTFKNMHKASCIINVVEKSIKEYKDSLKGKTK